MKFSIRVAVILFVLAMVGCGAGINWKDLAISFGRCAARSVDEEILEPLIDKKGDAGAPGSPTNGREPDGGTSIHDTGAESLERLP